MASNVAMEQVGEAIGSADTFVFGQAYADKYADQFSFGYAFDHDASGDVELALAELAPGASATKARVRVRGEAFHGLLANFRGARVTKSPLVFDSGGAAAPAVSGQRAFIVDFGGVRSVLGLAVPAGAKVVLVLPWMGIDFAPRAIYPVGGTYALYSLPVPDTAGKSSVGFPAVETAKLFVQIKGSGLATEQQFADQVRIFTAVLPTNVRASVNGRPVFFTSPGPLDREVELAGLADELNALARDASAPVTAKLKIATDTPGALVPLFDAAADLEIERSQAGRWGGRDTLAVPLQALTPTPVELVFPAADTATWKVRRIALELGGAFPRWRAFGPAGVPHGKLALRTSAQFSVARCFAVPGRTVLHGLALLLRLPAGRTELRLEIAADADGAPAADEPLATIDLALDAAPNGAPAWCEALAGTPLDTGDAARLWVVLKGKSGVAEWSAEGEAGAVLPATRYTNDGGRWQRYPVRGGESPAPFLRVLREPLAHENAPLATLSLAVGSGPAIERTADPSTEAPASVEFALPAGQFVAAAPAGGTATVGITVVAATSGTLELRRATAYFRT